MIGRLGLRVGLRSIKCMEGRDKNGRWMKGHFFSSEERAKISKSHKGKTPWNKGKEGFKKSDENKKRFSQYAKEHGFGKWMSKKVGKDSNVWKGDNVGYAGIHRWLSRDFGKPNRCENKLCVYPRKNGLGKIMLKPHHYEWAKLKNFPYARRREYFIQLCVSCHRGYDLYGKQIVV